MSFVQCITLGIILAIIGVVFGSFSAIYISKAFYIRGEQSALTAKQDADKKHEALMQQNKEILEHLKKIEIKGDQQLVDQIKKPDKWDFSQGTIVFRVEKRGFLNPTKLNLIIISEDDKAKIEFLKTPDNKVSFTYIYPSIGKIVRETQISSRDITEKGIIFAFVWDLKEAKTILYVNAIERTQ